VPSCIHVNEEERAAQDVHSLPWTEIDPVTLAIRLHHDERTLAG
jgi:hypothetical protein